MSLRRNNDFYDLLIVVSKILYYPFNKIKVSGTKNIPKKGPALLLPKHNLVRDVPIEGIIIRNECRRRAYFVMKDTLPRLLDYAGGIRVRRSKDVKETNYNMNKIIEKHNQKYNNNTLKLVGEAYKKGELVIVHPEGCSIDKKMLPLKKTFINYTTNFQKENNIKIPIIPIGIEYEKKMFRTHTHIRIGEPVNAETNDLVNKLYFQIKTLSNL